jgi:hypothetical protein
VHGPDDHDQGPTGHVYRAGGPGAVSGASADPVARPAFLTAGSVNTAAPQRAARPSRTEDNQSTTKTRPAPRPVDDLLDTLRRAPDNAVEHDVTEPGAEGIDHVTERFNRLVDAAGVRRIRLPDVRHTYATLALTSGVEPKIVSDRVGHSNPGVTFQIYTHPSVGADRAAAELLGQMIRQAIGGDDSAPPHPEGGRAADEAC